MLTTLVALMLSAASLLVYEFFSYRGAWVADLRTQADQQNSQNSTLNAQISMLKAQAKDLPKQQAKLAAVAAKIPDNPALPALIRALSRPQRAPGSVSVRSNRVPSRISS